MLRYLLDEHISPRVATQISKNHMGIVIFSLQQWHAGAFLQVDDALLLRAAVQEGLTLVTYDRRTMPGLLFDWGQAVIVHGGVVFIDGRSIAQKDVGGLVKALIAFWSAHNHVDWHNRLGYLKASTPPDHRRRFKRNSC
jgi:hypothetical protein